MLTSGKSSITQEQKGCTFSQRGHSVTVCNKLAEAFCQDNVVDESISYKGPLAMFDLYYKTSVFLTLQR